MPVPLLLRVPVQLLLRERRVAQLSAPPLRVAPRLLHSGSQNKLHIPEGQHVGWLGVGETETDVGGAEAVEFQNLISHVNGEGRGAVVGEVGWLRQKCTLTLVAKLSKIIGLVVVSSKLLPEVPASWSSEL